MNVISNLTILNTIISLIIGFCIIALFTSIGINIYLSKINQHKTKKEKKSIVETGTMTLFFLLIYTLLKTQTGTIKLNQNIHYILIFLGLIIIMFGTYVNIKGRFNLGRNWANQVKIYNDHTLINQGMYKYLRHPLYASIIWMFYGASFIYTNLYVFIANTIIFIPFMYYRAKQEEFFLTQNFKNYKTYQKKVGMFFPKVPKLFK